jgi:hypothetical protein
VLPTKLAGVAELASNFTAIVPLNVVSTDPSIFNAERSS